jgi:hypothetical protein
MTALSERRCLPLEVEAISLHRERRTVRPRKRSWLRRLVGALATRRR